MKKTVILLSLVFTSMISFGQSYTNLGIGISLPIGTLHVHSSAGIRPPVTPGGPTDRGDDISYDYQTIFHVTNTNTGVGSRDGFTIDQYNGDVTIHQYEQSNISLFGYNGTGFTLTPSGFFGLGTVSPTSRLHVNGDAHIEGNTSVVGTFSATKRTNIGSDCQILTIGKAHTEGMNYGTAYLGFNAQSSGTSWTCQSDGFNNGGAVIWTTIYGDIMFANISTTNSSSNQTVTESTLREHVNLKLGADGTLKAKEVRVTMTDWPDYVFDNSYNLMPLTETEQYIQTNGHLPNVPSATEVEADGMSVGEMNKVLLQKVEELTLYVIELQKQIDELKKN